jgi:hypothetical protein
MASPTERASGQPARNGAIANELVKCLAPLGGEVDGGEPVAELGMTNFAAGPRSLDQRPSLRIGEHGLEHEAVQPVTATDRTERAKDRRAGKSEIADRIERFVAHELI